MRTPAVLSICLSLLLASCASPEVGPEPAPIEEVVAPTGGSLPSLEKLAKTPLQAKWIWARQDDYKAYNRTIVAFRAVDLEAPRRALLRITADSFYRLFINGRWVNDGPCRSWPEHFQYDELDVTQYLNEGFNTIRILARYYGVGDFHRVPQQAGLLAQLDVVEATGWRTRIVTDDTWMVGHAQAWISNTPKVSIQMEPAELYDARLERVELEPAAVLYGATEGPWKGLHPRDVALMTKHPATFRSFLGAKIVRSRGWDFCLPAARLVNPGVIEANHTVSCACGMATVVVADEPCTLRIQTAGMKVAVDGRGSDDGSFELAAGRHLVLAFVQSVCGHDKEKALRFLEPTGFRLENPLDAALENAWCFLRFPEYAFVKDDLRWINFRDEDPEVSRIIREYGQTTDTYLKEVGSSEELRSALEGRVEQIPSDEMFVQDMAWQFQNRQVLREATDRVVRPGALIYDTPEETDVLPSPEGDVELLYDLGEQNCGYYTFELVAEAGVQVDAYGIEYITPTGRIQHTGGNRNGLRYITKSGVNPFTSLKRRSGRYVFITLRGHTTPVRIRNFRLVESTYPVEYVGSFSSSDARLDKIWEISTRTLKLCMEDTFTDCPLYEQTLWVGDARNESLLAYGVFGAEDLARRCIWLTAQSLDRYPFAGCQVPSCWDTLLPAWSFLWGISVWDYYWQTADRDFVRETWPYVIRNLKGAAEYVDDRDLFSGPFWNLFDWSGIDQGQKAVVHNSLFFIGAIDAALRCAEVIEDTSESAWLGELRQRLVGGVNRLWISEKGSYPDSIRDDGTISPSTCQHTSFLSILYDVIDEGNLAAATRNLLEPPDGMVRIGSPFAMLYLYETLEKLGMDDEIVREIYRNYLPMLESGATTVWESFPSGTTGSGGFPTRSHCHAWSSAPTYFLNRIILGVKTTAPGAREVEVSPRLSGLEWARGTTATTLGPVWVSWQKTEGALRVDYSAPDDTKVVFRRNETHEGLQIVLNGVVSASE